MAAALQNFKIRNLQAIIYLFLMVLIILFSKSKLNAQVLPSYDTVYTCSGVPVLAGIDPTPGNTYLWPQLTAVSNYQASRTYITPINNSPSELEFNYTLREFNSSGDLIQLISYSFFVAPRLYQDINIMEANICPGDIVTVEFGSNWNADLVVFPQTNISFNIIDSLVIITVQDSALYSFSYLDTAACIQRNEQVNIYFHERPVITLNSPQDVYCADDSLSYQFEYSPDSVGVFSGFGITQNGVFSPSLSPSGEQTIFYTITNNGCSTADSVSFSVFGADDVIIDNIPNFCQSADEVVLNFANPPGGDYFLDGLPAEVITPAELAVGLHTIDYEITIGESCFIQSNAVFNIIPRPAAPQIVASPDTVVCQGTNVTLNGGFFTNYEWSTGDTTLFLAVSESGVYSLVFVSSLGCRSLPDSIEIVVSSPPLSELSSPFYPVGYPISVYGANDGSIELTIQGGIPPFEISWSTGQTDTLLIDSLVAGVYFVSISDRAGCVIGDSITLEQPDEIIPPTQSATFGLPNAFTPNNDGYNDLYVINGLAPLFSKNKFRVWDESRRLVFEATDYDNTWDGKDLNGDRLGAATYFGVFESDALEKPIRTYINIRYE